MPSHRDIFRPLRRPHAVLPALVVVGALIAALATGIAAARTFVLATAGHATVSDTAGRTIHEAIVTTRSHRAVYWLTGDSRTHPECTAVNRCFAFWPPVTVSSTRAAVKPASIHGRLTTWRRDGFIQLVLAGHPLYRYAGDSAANVATGEGIFSFGGTWHVVRPGAATRAGSGAVAQTPAPSSTSPGAPW